MNKNKKNRKGFTIVELVIVIAVIGILATVLVPTFGDVITKANNAADLQEVKNAYTAYTAKQADKAGYTDNIIIKVDGVYYQVTNGSVVNEDGELVVATGMTADTTKYWDAASNSIQTYSAE